MFFQYDTGWMIYGLIMAAVIGMAIGVITGSFLSLILKLGMRGLWWDALLGAIGYVAANEAAILMPWSRSTPANDVGTTMVVMSLAAILPILRELYRFRKKKMA